MKVRRKFIHEEEWKNPTEYILQQRALAKEEVRIMKLEGQTTDRMFAVLPPEMLERVKEWLNSPRV
jgi:hypothetical protein